MQTDRSSSHDDAGERLRHRLLSIPIERIDGRDLVDIFEVAAAMEGPIPMTAAVKEVVRRALDAPAFEFEGWTYVERDALMNWEERAERLRRLKETADEAGERTEPSMSADADGGSEEEFDPGIKAPEAYALAERTIRATTTAAWREPETTYAIGVLAAAILDTSYRDGPRTLASVARRLLSPERSSVKSVKEMMDGPHDPTGERGWVDEKGSPTACDASIGSALAGYLSVDDRTRASIMMIATAPLMRLVFAERWCLTRPEKPTRPEEAPRRLKEIERMQPIAAELDRSETIENLRGIL